MNRLDDSRGAESTAAPTSNDRRRRSGRATRLAVGSFGELVARLERASVERASDLSPALVLALLRIVEIDTRSGVTDGAMLRARVKRVLAKSLPDL